MSAPHFFVDRLDAHVVELSAQDSRHALRSLRLRPGDPVSLADAGGLVGSGYVGGEREGRAVIEVREVRKVVRPHPAISVALSPPKGARLGWTIEKLAELGVDEAVLLHTDRSVRVWRGGREASAISRLRVTAREAAMQSRQAFVMEVKGVVPLAEALDSAIRPAILLWEGGAAPLGTALPDQAAAVRLIVGPEGGFSDAEVDHARAAGGEVASLGANILRTETAAVVGAALALARYGRLG